MIAHRRRLFFSFSFLSPYRWHAITTDCVTGLLACDSGPEAIAVFVDKLTKYVYLMLCKTTSDGKDWAD